MKCIRYRTISVPHTFSARQCARIFISSKIRMFQQISLQLVLYALLRSLHVCFVSSYFNNMHHVLLCSFLLCGKVALCTEIATETSTNNASTQQLCLLNQCINAPIRTHMQGGTPNKPDVCTWRGIDCTDRVITSLHISSSGVEIAPNALWILTPDWLPPTLKFIDVYNIRLAHVWSPGRLPRELLYLNLSHCRAYTHPNTNMRRLPAKLKELILIYSSVGGELLLDKLPREMRLLYIEDFPKFTKRIYVDYRSLPKSLEHLHVTSRRWPKKMKSRVMETGEAGCVRIQTSFDASMPERGSKYMKRFAGE